jgi:two-component system sensor kinase FixL
MSWVTVIWSAASGACLVLAGMHLVVWLRDRRARASLVFALTTLTIVGAGTCELGMMMSRTPEDFGRYLRDLHLWGILVIGGTIVFVRLYLGTGRLWLAGLTIGARLVSLALNYALPPNINYREIRNLHRIPFLGEEVAVVGEATLNPWMWFAQSTFVLWLIFMIDASVTLWRKGGPEGRRRAVMVGGGMSLFIVVGMGHTVLVLHQVIESPLLPSLAFVMMTVAMGYELSHDVLRASRLAHDLHESEQRLSLSASAAGIALWERNMRDNSLWLSSEGKSLFGMTGAVGTDFDELASRIHPDDRQRVLDEVRRAMESCGEFEVEHRLKFADGNVRWISSSGAAEKDGGAVVLRGVSLDITDRRQAESELHQQREQLSHTLRLATMSQMATSLAHELNQPLTAIANNAGAARRMMAKGKVTEAELGEILGDIVDDAHRAGEVIRGIRGMARRDQGPRETVDLSALVAAVQRLVAAEALARDCEFVAETGSPLPWVNANPVQLQQVLLNLLMNAFDASELPEAIARRVILRAEADGEATVHVSVRDHGPGLPPEGSGKWFEPFHTSKPNGLGMGLVIVRGIIEAHGGALQVDAAEGGGACFHFRLPAAKEEVA